MGNSRSNYFKDLFVRQQSQSLEVGSDNLLGSYNIIRLFSTPPTNGLLKVLDLRVYDEYTDITEAIRKLNQEHPQVSSLLFVSENKQNPELYNLAFEYGEPLNAYIYEEPTLWSYVEQIVEGLIFLESQGYHYPALSKQYVLVTGRGSVKLLCPYAFSDFMREILQIYLNPQNSMSNRKSHFLMNINRNIRELGITVATLVSNCNEYQLKTDPTYVNKVIDAIGGKFSKNLVTLIRTLILNNGQLKSMNDVKQLLIRIKSAQPGDPSLLTGSSTTPGIATTPIPNKQANQPGLYAMTSSQVGMQSQGQNQGQPMKIDPNAAFKNPQTPMNPALQGSQVGLQEERKLKIFDDKTSAKGSQMRPGQETVVSASPAYQQDLNSAKKTSAPQTPSMMNPQSGPGLFDSQVGQTPLPFSQPQPLAPGQQNLTQSGLQHSGANLAQQPVLADSQLGQSGLQQNWGNQPGQQNKAQLQTPGRVTYPPQNAPILQPQSKATSGPTIGQPMPQPPGPQVPLGAQIPQLLGQATPQSMNQLALPPVSPPQQQTTQSVLQQGPQLYQSQPGQAQQPPVVQAPGQPIQQPAIQQVPSPLQVPIPIPGLAGQNQLSSGAQSSPQPSPQHWASPSQQPSTPIKAQSSEERTDRVNSAPQAPSNWNPSGLQRRSSLNAEPMVHSNDKPNFMFLNSPDPMNVDINSFLKRRESLGGGMGETQDELKSNNFFDVDDPIEQFMDPSKLAPRPPGLEQKGPEQQMAMQVDPQTGRVVPVQSLGQPQLLPQAQPQLQPQQLMPKAPGPDIGRDSGQSLETVDPRQMGVGPQTQPQVTPAAPMPTPAIQQPPPTPERQKIITKMHIKWVPDEKRHQKIVEYDDKTVEEIPFTEEERTKYITGPANAPKQQPPTQQQNQFSSPGNQPVQANPQFTGAKPPQLPQPASMGQSQPFTPQVQSGRDTVGKPSHVINYNIPGEMGNNSDNFMINSVVLQSCAHLCLFPEGSENPLLLFRSKPLAVTNRFGEMSQVVNRRDPLAPSMYHNVEQPPTLQNSALFSKKEGSMAELNHIRKDDYHKPVSMDNLPRVDKQAMPTVLSSNAKMIKKS